MSCLINIVLLVAGLGHSVTAVATEPEMIASGGSALEREALDAGWRAPLR
jgi:hypothetical protein